MMRSVLAGIINFVVVIVMLIVIGLLFHKAHSGHGSVGVQLTGVSALIWIALTLVYLIVPKLTTGRTPGGWIVGSPRR